MIPTVPVHLSSSAKETTEQVTSALKSFYSNAASSLQCTDAIKLQLPSECSNIRDNDTNDSIELDWRSEDTTLSDLTIVIYDGSGGTPYHVHTLPLAFGGRRSNFVAEQIKQQQKKQSKGSKEYKIEIYVPPLAASYMPAFLDYIYYDNSSSKSLHLTTSNAPPLRYLSNRFDVRDLHAQITKQFLPRDLELNTAPKYCAMADTLKDYELRDKALRIMAERMERMNARHLKEMSPRLMRSLVQCERVECGGEVLSEKVAQWLRCRDGIPVEGGSGGDGVKNQGDSIDATPLTDEDFYWITHIQQMPSISQHEALFYLAYGSKFPTVMKEVGPASLKHRCLEACSGQWAVDHLSSYLEQVRHHDHQHEQQHPNKSTSTEELYTNLDTEMKVQLLEKVLVGAKNLTKEKEIQSAVQEGKERDLKCSNEIMYENLDRELECPHLAKVDKVIVLGCGIPVANGVYLANSTDADNVAKSSSVPPPLSPVSPSSRKKASFDAIYEKEAMWNGSRVTFLLMPQKSGKYYTHYKLCVRTNDNDRTVLYTSPTFTSSENGSSTKGGIPEQGWEVEGTSEMAEDGDIYPAPLFVGKVAGG